MKPSRPPLWPIFQEINQKHFDGGLDAPHLRWNARLKTSAGRFFPGRKRLFQTTPPIIEIAAYLLEELNWEHLVSDTLAHEMIHYWLWLRRRPYGHGPEFRAKMRAMGVSRYNPVPRLRPHRYAYRCPGCQKEFLARKKLPKLACEVCCKRYARGRFDVRFQLVLERTLDEVTG